VTEGAPPLDALLGGAPQRRRRRWASLAVLALAGVAAFVLFARFLYGGSPYYTARVERGDITPRSICAAICTAMAR
jgi:HlyD family secretion protein